MIIFSAGFTTTESIDTTTQNTDATTIIQTTTDPNYETTTSLVETTTDGGKDETTNQQTTTDSSQETTSQPAETTTNSKEETTNQVTTTDAVDTTLRPSETTTESNREETTNQQTTTDSNNETTTDPDRIETTTVMGTSSRPISNGNNSCPPIEEGQAHYVCPTGFRRHPQDCGMFYQCTQSPETSHLSIVTFNCPNGTVYDEDAIQCRDRTNSDNCPTKMDNASLRGTIFDLEAKDSPVVSVTRTLNGIRKFNLLLFQIQIRTKRSLCSATGHFPLEENDSCSSTFLRCGISNNGKMEGRVYRCPTGYIYWQKSRRCERSAKVPDCKQKHSRLRLGVPVEWSNLGRKRSLQL